MAPAYKLTYFNTKGVVEPVRYLFTYGGVEFEDIRVETEDWPKLKPEMPFGELPVLEYNGEKINQSISIARYVAELVKLTGKNSWDNLKINASVDNIRDLSSKLSPLVHETDEAKKKELLEVAVKETIPNYLSRFEKIVEKNHGYFATTYLTWADFYFAYMNERLNTMAKKDIIQESYPNLAALTKKVFEIPSIKTYRQTRPQTDR